MGDSAVVELVARTTAPGDRSTRDGGSGGPVEPVGSMVRRVLSSLDGAGAWPGSVPEA
ncbi:hypothetical protein F750_0529 [Streptomyces sp. PAMC 26508]|nr:hypothetical protein F750_0529 [Streptomyces sp. PAMC 26508]